MNSINPHNKSITPRLAGSIDKTRGDKVQTPETGIVDQNTPKTVDYNQAKPNDTGVNNLMRALMGIETPQSPIEQLREAVKNATNDEVSFEARGAEETDALIEALRTPDQTDETQEPEYISPYEMLAKNGVTPTDEMLTEMNEMVRNNPNPQGVLRVLRNVQNLPNPEPGADNKDAA